MNRLIARWERPLFAFAWRYTRNAADSQDLVAETFVRLHRQRGKFRPGTRLAAWLFTTLANLCHNNHRWRRRHPALSLDAPGDGDRFDRDSIPSDEALPAEEIEHDEAAAAVHRAVDRLPHDLRTTVLLHYFDKLSYGEIAAIVGCSERGVETRLYRARQRLRETLSRSQALAGSRGGS